MLNAKRIDSVLAGKMRIITTPPATFLADLASADGE
jgi:hypothetical protein